MLIVLERDGLCAANDEQAVAPFRPQFRALVDDPVCVSRRLAIRENHAARSSDVSALRDMVYGSQQHVALSQRAARRPSIGRAHLRSLLRSGLPGHQTASPLPPCRWRAGWRRILDPLS